ncbi:MAG: cytochrome C, partial [Aestuariibaculum sp.]
MKKPCQSLEDNITINMKKVIHRTLGKNVFGLSLIFLLAFSTAITAQEGDPAKGKTLFNTNCA